MRRVVVTGLGAVTPLGVGTRRTWNRLLAGECGIVSTLPLGEAFSRIPSQVAGLVPQGKAADGGWTAEEHVSKDEARKTAKFTQYALAAAEEALNDAGWKPTREEDLETTGVCLGSGIGNLEELYDTSLAYSKGDYRAIHPLFVPRILINLGAGHISMRYGFKGPNHAATTACTTGAHSLGDAYRFIQSSSASVMLAGGAESCIHPLALGGFSRTRSLSTSSNSTPQYASRPFSPSRAGFVIAEGASVVVLEEMEHAKQRGAEIYAELVGYGVSSDAFHLTAPRGDGEGALRAMRMALKEAGVPPRAVGYVNAHATGTRVGDKAENEAVRSLMFGAEGLEKGREKDVCVSSTKGAVGHLLGAAGALEALFAVLSLKEGKVPPTVNLGEGMEGEGKEEGWEEKMTKEGFLFNYVPNVSQEREVEVSLTNSFGFGGTNACLAFKRFTQR